MSYGITFTIPVRRKLLPSLINNHFNKSFNKQTFILTYKNRYPWMTNSLRTKIAEKNKLDLKSIKNPNNIELNRLYKRKRNQLISELRNT